ncbi:MAG: hypothetical protein HYY86_00735 [Candidatus Harrisonbacteria bacterium]|nr:hypothetical protein [Candidatus Harrisonbacteria bacterium]
MKLILVWPDKGQQFIHLISELKKHNHEIVYFVGSEGADEFKPPEAIFHFFGDAMNGRPAAGIDMSDFLPPGTDLIEKLYRTESLTLTMLNNLVPMNLVFKDEVNRRKHFYYHLVQYWFGVLKKYQPEAVILSYIPHNSYDFVLYSLAKLLGIKVLTFVDTRIPGRLLPLKDFWLGSERLQKELEFNREKNFSVDDLPEDIRKYYLRTTKKDFNEMPGNLRFLKKKYSLVDPLFISKVRASIQDGTIFWKSFGYLRWKWGSRNYRRWIKKLFFNISYAVQDNLKKEYRSFESAPDFSKKFIYVALQVQPECSTAPQGDVFVDQILMLETLSAALPENWIIYVKEHPLQWLRFGLGFSNYKNRGYYQKISEIKNVKIIPVETNSYRLIKESQAVATASGAPGWEATLWSKPAIIFGYPWYLDCPGIFLVRDVSSCRDAVNKIVNGFKVDPQLTINYLKSLGKAGIRGYRAPSAGEGSDLSQSESMKNIADFIAAELPKL